MSYGNLLAAANIATLSGLIFHHRGIGPNKGDDDEEAMFVDCAPNLLIAPVNGPWVICFFRWRRPIVLSPDATG